MFLRWDVFHCPLIINCDGVAFVPMAALTALIWLLGAVAVTMSVPLDIMAFANTLVPMVCVTVLVTTVPLGGQLTQPVTISAARISACIFILPCLVSSLVRKDSSRKIVCPICAKDSVGVHSDAPEAVCLVANHHEGLIALRAIEVAR